MNAVGSSMRWEFLLRHYFYRFVFLFFLLFLHLSWFILNWILIYHLVCRRISTSFWILTSWEYFLFKGGLSLSHVKCLRCYRFQLFSGFSLKLQHFSNFLLPSLPFKFKIWCLISIKCEVLLKSQSTDRHKTSISSICHSPVYTFFRHQRYSLFFLLKTLFIEELICLLLLISEFGSFLLSFWVVLVSPLRFIIFKEISAWF